MKKPEIILGISLGTRKIGIVTYYNGEFIDWRLKTFPGKWNSHKLENILSVVERLFQRYKPCAISIKVSGANHAAQGILQLRKGIERICGASGIRLHSYSLKEIEAHCSRGKKKTKKALITFLVENYPDFQAEYVRATRWKGNAHERIFEAAGAIVLYVRDTK
jgi:hypothetical protein